MKNFLAPRGTKVYKDLQKHHCNFSNNNAKCPNRDEETKGLRDDETKNHPEFSLALQTNLADGSGGGSSFRFVGNEGVLTLKGGSILLEQNAPEEPSEDNIVKGYNSVYTFSSETQDKFVEEYRKLNSTKRKPTQLDSTVEYQAPEGYSDRTDHFYNFFEAVRTGGTVLEDAVFGFRAAAPALLSNDSYLKGNVIGWDPDKMELIS